MGQPRFGSLGNEAQVLDIIREMTDAGHSQADIFRRLEERGIHDAQWQDH